MIKVNNTIPSKPDRGRMKKWLAAGVIPLLLVIMVLTNPDRDDFQGWLNHQIRKPSDGLLGSTLKKSVHLQANYNITYSDKILFSTAGTRVAGQRLTFLGVFGTWLPLP